MAREAMTDYQAVLCPQCKGEMTIEIEMGSHIVDRWSLFLRHRVIDYQTIQCGYCEGKGFIAVDADALVKR